MYMDKILEFLSVNNSIPVVVIVIAGFIIMAFVQAHYIMQSKVKEIKKETGGKIEKAVEDIMICIEETSYLNSKEIMDERWATMAMCMHDETEATCRYIKEFYPMENGKFRAILHACLEKVRISVMQHIAINGFHDLSSKELDIYCENVGLELFEYSGRVMRLKGIDDLELIKDTHGLRYSGEESIESYKEIIEEVIRLEKEEKDKVADVKKRLKINGKIFDFFKGYLDGN